MNIDFARNIAPEMATQGVQMKLKGMQNVNFYKIPHENEKNQGDFRMCK